jgi:hypothetical protein
VSDHRAALGALQSATHHPLPASENATRTTSLLAAWCQPGHLPRAQRPAIRLSLTGHHSCRATVISPTLANLFLHYAFDTWMTRTFPAVPFERYADDSICHCRSEEEARALWVALEARFAACGLVLHPQKTKLVYCKDTNRRGDFPIQTFTFLGYMFRPRKAIWRGGQYGVSFLTAASPSYSAHGRDSLADVA